MTQKLLLADDSVTIQRVIELTFSGEDIQVVSVNDGEQAIARIPVERPDIVLADIGMPKKGGYDVAAFVKGRIDLEHIPVLLLAGAFEPVDQARAEQVRCDGVLIKPFEPRQVIERVRELLEGAKGSPSQATADVPRPVDRLAPRPEPQYVPFVPTVAAVPSEVAAEPAEAAGLDTPGAPPILNEDTSLDDYFESLNVAFSSVGDTAHASTPQPPADTHEEPASSVQSAPAPSTPEPAARVPVPAEPWLPTVEAVVPPPERHGSEWPSYPEARAPRRRGDSLDDYFDRLSTAFEHVKPAAPSAGLPDTFGELMGPAAVPAVDAVVPPSTHDDFGFVLPSQSAQPPESRPADPPASWLMPETSSPAVALAEEPERSARNPIVEALEAMLAAPAPESEARVSRAPAGTASATAAADDGGELSAVSHELVDQVTARVLEQLVPEIAAQLRRLVREEIARRLGR